MFFYMVAPVVKPPENSRTGIKKPFPASVRLPGKAFLSVCVRAGDRHTSEKKKRRGKPHLKSFRYFASLSVRADFFLAALFL